MAYPCLALSEIVMNGGNLPGLIIGMVILAAYILMLGALVVYCYEKRVTP
jgi:putative effector of murein hydrolase LrgA (UPF0299 family)